MKNVVSAMFFVVFVIAAVESKATAQDVVITNQNLAGTWIQQDVSIPNTLIFNSDGTMKWNGKDHRYEVVTVKSINMTKIVLHNAKNERFETDGIMLSPDGKMLFMWDSGMEHIYIKKDTAAK